MSQEDWEGTQILALIDELRSEDLNVKLNALNNLSLIAKALGSQRTEQELVPYLEELCEDNDEEALLAMAKNLGELTTIVKAEILLEPLAQLAGNEECVVRDQAVASLKKVARCLDNEKLNGEFAALVKQLGISDWFSCRMAASNLISVVLEKVENQPLLQLFQELCQDDTPMVRRTCAECLKDFSIYAEQLMPEFKKLASDNQDSVKQMAIESSIAFTQQIKNEVIIQDVLPMILEASKVGSWRIRFSVAEILPGLVERLQSADQVIQILLQLLKDTEIEVRSNACASLGKLSQ